MSPVRSIFIASFLLTFLESATIGVEQNNPIFTPGVANFDKSGIDTSGKTPDEIGQMKSDYYHDNMDKASRAKKASDRLSKKK